MRLRAARATARALTLRPLALGWLGYARLPLAECTRSRRAARASFGRGGKVRTTSLGMGTSQRARSGHRRGERFSPRECTRTLPAPRDGRGL